MFYNAVTFNNGEMTNKRSNPLNWNIGSVTTMNGIFEDTKLLINIYVIWMK